MSKRSDTIRNLFAASQVEMLSADNNPTTLPRVTSGSVRSVKESFSGIERENEDLRAQLQTASAVIELDPNLVDPSPVADRMDDKDEASFDALKASIRQYGQEVPVLLRAHPTHVGRYQSAYGHRRVRAARELGVTIKAVIRAMSDEQLVVAQGIENSARQDLSFIERARFAERLEGAGYDRAVIQAALSIDRAEASKLLAVIKVIPADIIDAIGRAAKIGRGRWQELADLLGAGEAVMRLRRQIGTTDFAALDSDARFMRALGYAKAIEAKTPVKSRTIVTALGQEIAGVATSERELKLVIDRTRNAGFADFLIGRLPKLFENYVAEHPE